MPMRGRIGQIAGTRELVMTPLPYIIVYGVEREIVHIFRVLHAAEIADRFNCSAEGLDAAHAGRRSLPRGRGIGRPQARLRGDRSPAGSRAPVAAPRPRLAASSSGPASGYSPLVAQR